MAYGIQETIERRLDSDEKTLKKINKLIEDICRNGNSGLGKPETLLEDFGVAESMKKID